MPGAEPDTRVMELMRQFAARTGLDPPRREPRRYLWTDAFAVCNLLGLFRRSGSSPFLDLALQLVDQVHLSLGRHRSDDRRRGWISGLDEEEGRRHPTRGGLRIGKPLGERGPGEPLDERLEWERDGQYYHYLTKWLHALDHIARVTGEGRYYRWAVELARTAHAAFIRAPEAGGPGRIAWKMSIDLSRPQVSAMGQHDPLDGLVSFCQLQAHATDGSMLKDELDHEIGELNRICRSPTWVTDDPLGLGGLLFDAGRIAQLTAQDAFPRPELLPAVLDATLTGLKAWAGSDPLQLPLRHRLPFRELGLAIGLQALPHIARCLAGPDDDFRRPQDLQRQLAALERFQPLGSAIRECWLAETSRQARTWQEHEEINTVMLATSLAPEEFLRI